MNADERRFADLTHQVIGCAMEVSNTLGCGFLEKVYENAMAIALQNTGLAVEQQVRFEVQFANQPVGEYICDLLVERTVVVEVKAIKALDDAHFAQCMNYLKVTNLSLCLLFNFAKPRLEWKRIVREFPV